MVKPLPPVPPEAWIPYLLRKYQEIGRPIDEAFARALAERTGGHPYCTMVVANKVLLVRAVQPELSSHLLLDLAYSAGLEDMGNTYDEAYRVLSAPPLCQEVLLRLAAGEPPYQGEPSIRIKRALAALVDAGHVRRTARGHYTFPDPMFADYLRRVKG